MPINIDNGLPTVAMQFGPSDDKEMSFNVLIDLCTGLNTGNLRVRQWVINKYPYIFKNYMEFDDKDTFGPLGFNCAVDDVKYLNRNVGNLTVIVTYCTRYKSIDKFPILLLFGLGNEVTVNTIIRKPTLIEWKGCVNVARDIFTFEELMLQFDMEYKEVDAGLPKYVISYSAGFFRPRTTYLTGSHIISSDRGYNSTTIHTESHDKVATISDTHMDGCFTRSVTKSEAL